MKITNIRLSNFRNVKFADISLNSQYVRIFGINAQGKSNMLEALSLLGAMRSFRTSKLSNLIRFGEKCASLIVDVESKNISSQVSMELSQKKNKVSIDDCECSSLASFIGRYPVLAMACDDLQLIKSAPALRRRFMDIYISSLDAEYFLALRNYHKALLSRNALLKIENASDAEFDAFEYEMAKAFSVISDKRKSYLEELSKESKAFYGEMAKASGEKIAVVLKSSSSAKNADEYLNVLHTQRESEKIVGSTKYGIHKDDLLALVGGKAALSFASDGQQRSIALSLRLAQLEILAAKKDEHPVLLCDDILGELDNIRKDAFWKCINKSVQVIATATSSAKSNSIDWLDIETKNGEYFFLK